MLKALPCHSASKKVSRFLVDSLHFRLPFDDVVFFAPYLGLLLTVLLTLWKIGLFAIIGIRYPRTEKELFSLECLVLESR